MRIGIDARMYGSKITGIGNYVRYLIEELSIQDSVNEYIVFVLQDNHEVNINKNNFKVIKVNSYWYTLSEQLKFFNQLKQQNLDLVHFPNFNTPVLYNKKFIVTIHDLTPKYFPGPKVKKSFFRKLAYNYVLWHSIKKSVNIITVSNHVKEDIIHVFGVNESKIKVIYPGIGRNFQKSNTYDIINTLKLKYRIKYPYVFYAGVWREHKNISGLILAFEILLKKYNFQLQLVLGGDQKGADQKIFEIIQKKSLRDYIVMTGFIPDNCMPHFYSMAQVTVIPSFCEGFGLIGVESLACECPVAASRQAGLDEILKDAALYFNPHNVNEMAHCIDKLLFNADLRKSLIKNFKNISGRYSWTNCALQTLRTYETFK